MHDIEVLKWGELRVWFEWGPDEKLPLLGVDVEAVSGVDADFLADASDEAVHLLVEITGVVDHVEVGMADPGSGCVVIQLPREFHAFGTASVVLEHKSKTLAYSKFMHASQELKKISEYIFYV